MLHIIAPSPGRAILGRQGESSSRWPLSTRPTGTTGRCGTSSSATCTSCLQGNLGYSYKLNQTVNSLLAENWARTAYLTGIALFLAVLIAIPSGIFQAVKRNSIADQAVTAAAFTAYAMPDNFLGLILIGLFAIQLHWFPAEASQSESVWRNILDVRSMFLPIVTLASTSIASYSRYMRSSALDALAQDYIRLARAKGLPERSVLRRHLLRNASLAMITLIGLSVPVLLGGDVVEEYLFNFHGVGLLFVNELDNQDFPTVIALVLIGGVLTVIGNLIADVALSVADPRIRIV